ncbi:MAG: MBL fold metallo-hydrolase [bacterium]|nr:MBL fold metallo-hydrolase [bacterium]
MQITWLGQSCFKIDLKFGNDEVTIITDPFNSDTVGLKLPRTLIADIVLQTGDTLPHPVETKEGKRPFVIGAPGEYEVKGVFVYAIPLNPEGDPAQHIFWIEAEQIVLTHLGNLNHIPSAKALEQIEDLDVLLIPVGGQGVLDAKKAEELISELEPRLVIPMHYKIDGLKIKRDTIDSFLKAVGAKSETIPKLKLSKRDLPVDEMRVVVLEKS